MNSEELKTLRKAFSEWYQQKTGKPLPRYIPSEEKKKLKTQFEQETKIKYTA